jgi:hypothetical protein
MELQAFPIHTNACHSGGMASSPPPHRVRIDGPLTDLG